MAATNMKILGIDYGRAKIGLAIAEGPLSAPLKVVWVDNWKDALEKILKEIETEQPEIVVVGVSEGKMGQEQEQFAQSLSNKLAIPVERQEETLSTQEAQHLAREAGIPLLKRRKMEDAYAAAVMLQSWLDRIED